ncbi:pyridine nucleotide-disulfide oxidoreductase [Corynebacterium sp. zg254]|uniref:ferredoxin--NADP(+) reductase n=1 Tax=Corynebacterium zhongnanshanii TaxID=2768834 RepID=A0ABQ6VCD9_9CORY|nr:MULTISPECIES: FAD-dependent oxidoreductase [Corynebacterium]KAB3519892.1 pyridine nucleotide-disulfide oxidoreductase [Corynebacterium zhongnanshanii]MCR5914836.1 pyridine nucleotide-disulfide oxidoreductase [Corynebacterium sp. zg254]
MPEHRPLRVAVIGSGPAGIYASDALTKSNTDVSIDIFERMPAPFGLIRYGVAPDHPRIKGIIKSLHKVLDKPEIRLFGNINVGEDVTLDELKNYYDSVIYATGATDDRDLDIPGGEHTIGAGEFVGFYDANPHFEESWTLDADSVAVVGVGNVGLDVARVLAKTGDELLVTEIPDNVYDSLKDNKAKEVHVFGRRGPAQAKFTPLELKELNHSDTIEVVVDPEDIQYDAGSEEARRSSKIQDMVCTLLEQYAIADPKGAPHKLYLHFFESPVEVKTDDNGKVVAFVTERTELTGNGSVRGTGKLTEWPVGAVYRAVGYKSDQQANLPWDDKENVLPNVGGRVLTEGPTADGIAGVPGSADPEAELRERLPGVYATGWIRRGPVGLIGNTKGDANEAVANLLEDSEAGIGFDPAHPAEEDVNEFLKSKGLEYTTWEGWYALDKHERALGEAEGRERKKVREWDEMLKHSNNS